MLCRKGVRLAPFHPRTIDYKIGQNYGLDQFVP